MAMAATLLDNVEKSLTGREPAAEVDQVPNSEDHAAENGNGKIPELVYSKELLLKLKRHPASVVKPECLDPAHMVTKSGKWDPEHWMSNDSAKRSNSVTVGTNLDDKAETHKKREKPREESDDYCFTPQRRSFVSGCQVAAARKLEADAAALPVGKEKAIQPRRPPLNQPQQEQRGFQPRNQPREKDPRRPMDRTAFDRDGGNRNTRTNGYHDRRHAEVTPEWFFGGPTSQNETIELKGFDEESGRGKRKVDSKKAADGPTRETASAKTETKAGNEKDAHKEQKKEPEFNFDDLLNMDTGNFNDVSLDALAGDSTLLQGSKFSRWFKKPEEEKKPDEVSIKDKEDAAKSLLEMLHKGSEQPVQQQQQQQPKLQGVLTAEEVERMANKRNALAALKNLLPPPKEAAVQKEARSAARPMTEQDLLASLLGNKMNLNKAPPQQNQPTEDILTKFLQTAGQQQHQQQHVPKPPEQIQQQAPMLPPPLLELQQRAALQSMLNAAAAGLNGPPTLQQLEFLAKQRQLMQVQQQLQRQTPPVKTSSASPLAFTPTAVMRKMTADKDKDKLRGHAATDKTTEDAPGSAQNQGTNTRLTGRTASQVGGPEPHSSGVLPTAASVAGPPLQQLLPPPLGAFGNAMNPGNAITDMALRLLEQQQQQQLLARAVAVSAAQNQLKQAMKQQQQRLSPLQQPLLGHQVPPMMPRNHFRPIHAQPAMGPSGQFLSGTLPPPGQQQQQPRGAAPRLREPFPNMSIQQQMAAALQAQRMNPLPNGRPLNSAQPQAGANNPLARWLAQDFSLQGPPVPNP